MKILLVLPFVVLLDLTIETPLFTLMLGLSALTKDKIPESFQADTRNGASLKFTNKESFLS
jgi:hypothetical protein